MNQKRTQVSAYYMRVLKKFRISPNFWCSSEYFDKAGLVVYEIDNLLYVYDDSVLMFPPINEVSGEIDASQTSDDIWSDFPSIQIENRTSVFLDYEYIYSPSSFLHLSGGKWKSFRKNTKRWFERNRNYSYSFPEIKEKEILQILQNWLSTNQNRLIQDPDTLVKYLLKGESKRVLKIKDRVVGINAWDCNWKYTNFRYSICEPEEYLSEALRYLFYTDPTILKKDKLINDGGVLGSLSLRDFKNKLNPIQIREVNSWKI